MSVFHELYEATDATRSGYLAQRHESLARIAAERLVWDEAATKLVESSSTISEVVFALKASPSGMPSRFNAFLKWVALCDTASEAAQAYYFWNKHSRAHSHLSNEFLYKNGVDQSDIWFEFDPALDRWVALSLAEIETAHAPEALGEAYRWTPLSEHVRNRNICRRNQGLEEQNPRKTGFLKLKELINGTKTEGELSRLEERLGRATWHDRELRDALRDHAYRV